MSDGSEGLDESVTNTLGFMETVAFGLLGYRNVLPLAKDSQVRAHSPPPPMFKKTAVLQENLDTGFHGHKQSLASLQRICGPVRWLRCDLCLKCPAPYLRVGTHGTRGPETEQFQSKAIQTDSQTAALRGYGADSVSDPPSPSSFVSKVGSMYLSRVVVSIKPDNGFKKQPCG